MTYITFTGWLSYAGCYAASLSSAIASLIGAPRILQVIINTETIFKCHPGCWEGWDLPGGWLVWKGRQCQQRSNQRWSCLCFTATDVLFSMLATAVVNILSFDLDVHNQVISSALPLRWVLWWLPTWMQLELSLPISSLQGNARWWLLCYQLCTSRCICRCIHTLIQWELSSTVVGY